MNGPENGLPRWAWALGEPFVHGRIRSQPEDFRVFEIPMIEPEGSGNHLWLEIEKRGANTNWVAGELSRAAGVHPKEVGFAGMKDRNGVTRQWFSVGLQEASRPDPEGWAIEDVTVLQHHRHTRKLKRGTLRGNRFRLVVRDLAGDRDQLEDRLQSASANGVPNYFGDQRFGHGGAASLPDIAGGLLHEVGLRAPHLDLAHAHADHLPVAVEQARPGAAGADVDAEVEAVFFAHRLTPIVTALAWSPTPSP